MIIRCRKSSNGKPGEEYGREGGREGVGWRVEGGGNGGSNSDVTSNQILIFMRNMKFKKTKSTRWNSRY